MITPTMTAQEVAQDARQDLHALWNKVKGISKKQEHKHRKERDRNHLLEAHIDWRSPRGNNWLIVLRTNKKETTVSTLVWYRGRDERLRAMQVNLLGPEAIAISAHVLERYMVRFDPGRNPIQRLQDFFFANHTIVRQPIEDIGNGKWKVMAGLYHGLATGEHDEATNITVLTTFLDYGKLGAEQLQLADFLDFQRELHAYPAGFRNHVLRLLEEERKKAA